MVQWTISSGERRELGRAARQSRSHRGDGMKVWMTYNAKCGTARNVLELLRARGIEPTLREYLKEPLTADEITALAKKMKAPLRDLVRWKQKDEVAAAGIKEDSADVALLKAMVKYPVL